MTSCRFSVQHYTQIKSHNCNRNNSSNSFKHGFAANNYCFMLVYGPFAANAITSRRAFVSIDIYKPFSLTEIQDLTIILRECKAKSQNSIMKIIL